MKEYMVEMLRMGKWVPAYIPNYGTPPIVRDIKQAKVFLNRTRIAYPGTDSTDYRIVTREVTEWEVME